MAANAAGSFMARSARTLRLRSTPAWRSLPIRTEYERPCSRAPALIRCTHKALNSLFLCLRSLYAYTRPFSTAFLATVQTFFRRPKYPFACLRTLFRRAREATLLTDLDIFVRFFGRWRPTQGSFRPKTGLNTKNLARIIRRRAASS